VAIDVGKQMDVVVQVIDTYTVIVNRLNAMPTDYFFKAFIQK
jgi:hypothetical protein